MEVCFEPNRRGAQKSLAALQDRAMVKRTAPIRVISLILLSACGALCQKRPSTDLLQGLQFDGSHLPEVQRQEMRTWRSLPDAPSSVQPPTQAARFHTFVDEASSPLTLGAISVSPGVMRGTEMGHVTPGPPSRVENRRSGFSLPVAADECFRIVASVRFGLVLFPVPAHRTGQADVPHPALGKDTRWSV